MIERRMYMRTEAQAKRLARELEELSGVCHAYVYDKTKVEVSYTSTDAERYGDRLFWEIDREN